MVTFPRLLQDAGYHTSIANTDEAGVSYTHTPNEDQQAAMAFLVDHVFTTPEWLLQEEIINNTGPDGTADKIRSLQINSSIAYLLRVD